VNGATLTSPSSELHQQPHVCLNRPPTTFFLTSICWHSRTTTLLRCSGTSIRRSPMSGAMFDAKMALGTTANAVWPNVEQENSSGATSAGNPTIHGQFGSSRCARCTDLSTQNTTTASVPKLTHRQVRGVMAFCQCHCMLRQS